MKTAYISLMAQALSAYTDDHIRAYLQKVRTEGLTEHGFPRLTANLGILISHGYRRDLTPLFLEMMELCCTSIPHVRAANDFSVREIVLCLLETERAGIAPSDTVARWRSHLATIDPLTCYNRFALHATDRVNNWACFTGVSEFVRRYAGLGGSDEFIDTQLASQLIPTDENGMYRDPNEPMVYDLVPRGLFALLLSLGYNGKYRDAIDDVLRRSGIHTLTMQSTTGEIPYGGRSNQFIFNDALAAIVLEYEAVRYASLGDSVTAGYFKDGALRVLEVMSEGLSLRPVSHVKNRFPLSSRYGCENYAYFDKYMITAASYLYSAYLICDDSISPVPLPSEPRIWQTSEHFHKLFMRCGDYALEFDTAADPIYDASGLGRLHRRGAPSAICLSLPCTATPKYTVDLTDTVDLSLCPVPLAPDGSIAHSPREAKHAVTRSSTDSITAIAEIESRFDDGSVLTAEYSLSRGGVSVKARGDGKVRFMLPAFAFDGEKQTAVTYDSHSLTVVYGGWVCRYTTDGVICPTARKACNRNGHYHVFFAESDRYLSVSIEIYPNKN